MKSGYKAAATGAAFILLTACNTRSAYYLPIERPERAHQEENNSEDQPRDPPAASSSANGTTSKLAATPEAFAHKFVVSDDPDYRHWRALADAKPSLDLPAPALLPTFQEVPHQKGTPLADADKANPLPTISVRNLVMNREVDVGTLLRALADAADINVVIGENVSGPIKINLHAETQWDRLFLSTVQAHGLHYEWEDDLLRVMAREDIERQITMERALKDRQQAVEDRRSSEPFALELYRIRYADAERLATSISNGLAALSAPDALPTSVIADPDSGLLIFHATPSGVERARKLAEALDQPARQILIEATIVQADSETARELGIRWGVESVRGSTVIGTAADPEGFNSNFPAAFDPGETGFTFGLERLTNTEFLQAQLSALQRDGQLKIISNPSITTLDKQTAIIESGEERAFQTAVGTGIVAVPTIEFKKAVLRLEVTPQVIDGDWIKLEIITTKDEFDDSRPIQIAGTTQVPIITRAASTMLYLTHGETTVIGGLSTESTTSQTSGIPFLKDIPVIGLLFRNSANRTSLSDTMIFITPYILPNDPTL